MRRHGIAAIDPNEDAQRRYAREVDSRMTGTVWVTGGRGWYLDTTGRNSTPRPGFATTFRGRLRRFAPADHRTMPPTPTLHR
jgi:hypothetical protein